MTGLPVAVLTGASSGIGAAIARRLLADGWAVLGISRSAPAIVDAAFTHIRLDLASAGRGEVAAALAGIAAGAFVHAAGVLRVGGIGAMDAASGEVMWRLHVQAACLIGDVLAERFATGGRIVLIGSRAATGAAEKGQYAASKAAVVGLARSWAMDLLARGITVNVIAPGATDTPMLADPARGGTPPRMPPLGRYVRPEEVAALAGFLLGPDAGAITGQVITVCGGGSL